MAARNYGALPVMSGERLVGILSERDCARKVELQGRSAKTTRVAEIMTPDPIVVSPAHTLEDCMALMTERGFRHLPVVSGGKLLGFLSMKDAVKAVLGSREEFLLDVVGLGIQKDMETAREKAREVQRLISAFHDSAAPLNQAMKQLRLLPDTGTPQIRQIVADVEKVIQSLEKESNPVFERIENEKKLRKTRVLLANGNRQEEVIAKLALGGSGVTLHTAHTEAGALELLGSNDYDIVCVNHQFIEIAAKAREKNKNVNTVFLTSEDAEGYLEKLKLYPFLSNVVSQSEGDRAFTIKSILSTVSKIVNNDYFGLEKHLNWGTEIRERKIASSTDRPATIAEMSEKLLALGLRKTLVSRCECVVEELLMNALYAAPVDTAGKPRYNHLSREAVIELEPSEQPSFSFGCDGMFLGVSVRDPFGSLKRETILDYLFSCFAGVESSLHKDKGGGGLGIFMILRSATLTIFNVDQGASTEVIALFDLEPKQSGKQRTASFQYFTI